MRGVAAFCGTFPLPPQKKSGGPTTFMDAAQMVAIQTSMISVAAQGIILISILGRWTVLISLRVMLSNSLIRIYSQSWGSSVDALNTTYPSPLPDHRVLLTVVFVPLAHGRITMLHFCT